MEARLIRALLFVALILPCLGASYRTQNFIITAPTDAMAKQVGDMAEKYRRNLAIEWLGTELPPWQSPCPVTVTPSGGAGGVTSFMFERGRPFGWQMAVQGPIQRILDSVLPHEITHTIFATHFGRPLPRWADEGACTTVEHESERAKQQHFLIQFLSSQPSRGIAFNRMFAMTEYPPDMLPLYSQGYSVARFLIAQGGRQKFIQFVGDGMNTNDWPGATRRHYGYQDLSELQLTWLDWVRSGSPEDVLAAGFGPKTAAASALAANDARPNNVQPAGFVSDGSAAFSRPNTDTSGATVQQAGYEQPSELSWYAQQAAGARQSVTRPQPVGEPQQQVLEWDGAPKQPAPRAGMLR